MKKIIKSDAFNIAKRIKKIDKNYLIKFNTKNNKFEVYYKRGFNEKLELSLPFESLNYKTIQKIFETKIENLKFIIEQMDENNKKLEKQEFEENLLCAKELIKNCVKSF